MVWLGSQNAKLCEIFCLQHYLFFLPPDLAAAFFAATRLGAGASPSGRAFALAFALTLAAAFAFGIGMLLERISKVRASWALSQIVSALAT